MKSKRNTILIIAAAVIILYFIFDLFVGPHFLKQTYSMSSSTSSSLSTTSVSVVSDEASATSLVTHIPTPVAVRGIYMSSWVAGSPTLREKLVNIAETTEVNAVVIDIKDYTGNISFMPNDPKLKAFGSGQNRIPDIDQFIAELHKKGIYVIGRVASFQDPYMVEKRPELAVKRQSDGGIWKDHKGITWIDAGAKDQWDYLVEIAKESYSRGFDEIQYDYIRYPSDGDMQDISFPYSNGRTKHEVIKEFFTYVTQQLKGSGIVLSADLFGLTTESKNDLGIGQVLEDALTTFDYVSPMVYPSHYPPTWHGFKNPADHPYDVVKDAMTSGAAKAVAATTSPLKLRPWLQDFNLGADYTDAMARDQINATYDSGLNSWLIWNAANHYHAGAFLPK